MTKLRVKDRSTVDVKAARKTRDGFLVYDKVPCARTGVQSYRGAEVGQPGMEYVRIYRPESVVFAKDSMASYAMRPVTVQHPDSGWVDSVNWKDETVGMTGGEVARDGENVVVPVILMDENAIRLASGEGPGEISMGYDQEIEFEPGKTEDGTEYDAIAKDIRINHLSIVDTARGGPDLNIKGAGVIMPGTVKMKIGDVDVTLDEQTAQIVNSRLSAMDARIAEFEKSVKDANEAKEAAEAEKTTLKKELETSRITPEQLDRLAEEQSLIKAFARKILGDSAVKDKSAADLRKAVVTKKLGDACDGWTDVAIDASFATMMTVDTDIGQPGPASEQPDPNAPPNANDCLLYTSPSPRDRQKSRMPSSA